MSIRSMFFIFLQYVIPQKFLSRAVARLANCRIRFVKNSLIYLYVKYYRPDLSWTKEKSWKAYATFNEFFTRAFDPALRPIVKDRNIVISPVDGFLNECGKIQENQLLQAKDIHYTLEGLLGDVELAARFQNGTFATLYLAPTSYHRVHVPLAGKLQEMIYVPGKLFSVNLTAAAHIPQLFTRNERLISLFETEIGLVAVIMVGAVFVAGIKTTWAGKVCPNKQKTITRINYINQSVELKKGDEMGCFEFGSSVIVLFEPNKIVLDKGLCQKNQPIMMGEKIGHIG